MRSYCDFSFFRIFVVGQLLFCINVFIVPNIVIISPLTNVTFAYKLLYSLFVMKY